MSINLTQKFVYETDDLESLRLVLWCMIRVLFHDNADHTQLHLKHHVPVHFSHTDHNMWVTTLCDYKNSVRKLDRMSDNFDDMLDAIESKLTAISETDFKHKCGDGRHGTYMSFDGSVGCGYRIESRWSVLDISLVHIYYGK